MFNLQDNLKCISTNWKGILENIIIENKNNEKFCKKMSLLCKKLTETNTDIIYPPIPLIFNAFNHFDFENLNVVIIGQDPYHQKNQAMGLSFSVSNDLPKTPPSLKNIFKELAADLHVIRENSDLTDWAKQGILLLNSSLTVVHSKPNVHQKHWEIFTDLIIKEISDKNKNIVFLLWGNYARSKKLYIDTDKHHIFEAVHPSPLSASRGWFGSKHFSQTNAKLIEIGKTAISW